MAKQLSNNYGDRAWTVCALAEPTGEQWPVHGVRLSPTHPYVEAEVLYATRHEYACTAVDVLARRTRLAFVDAQAALAALPRVIEIMSKELGWSRARQWEEYTRGMQFLGSMGLGPEWSLRSGSVGNVVKGGNLQSSWLTWFKNGFWRLASLVGASAPFVGLRIATVPAVRSTAYSSFEPSHGRAKFEMGEVDALQELFELHAFTSPSSSSPRRMLDKAAIRAALNEFARE